MKPSQSTGSTRGRGGRSNTTTRGRGRGTRGNYKQTTLDMSISTTRSRRTASSVARAAFQSSDQDAEDIGTSSGSEEVMADVIAESDSEPEPTPTKGRKRQATQNKEKRPPASGQKRGRKSASSGVTRTTYLDMVDDKDEEDEEDQRRSAASTAGQTQTRRSWGSLRR